MAEAMSERELLRLSDLLGKWHEYHPDDGNLRDKASVVRYTVDEELEERFNG